MEAGSPSVLLAAGTQPRPLGIGSLAGEGQMGAGWAMCPSLVPGRTEVTLRRHWADVGHIGHGWTLGCSRAPGAHVSASWELSVASHGGHTVPCHLLLPEPWLG